jgi:2-dehydro-3-deoxyphosphooctonate aldolase (KDO 8-P synthase)
LGNAAGGRRKQLRELALAGVATGLAGVFLESHPDPATAKCDGPCAWPLDQVAKLLRQLKEVDELVKGFEEIEIE